MVAPPGITDEEFAELQAVIAETVETPEWRDALERNQWQDVYLTGPEFEQFIEEDRAEIEALIEELDL
jgi:putative tricarboxylic transport membrane protein